MNPKCSIIIASYNSAKTINKTLNSVVNQEFQDWECIVIDGKSSDNTVSIIDEYSRRCDKIRYISEPDNGIYDAFNKGWKLAKGEWIYYLGSDDILTKESFIKLVEAPSNGYDVVSGGCWIVKIDGSLAKQMSHGFEGCHQAKLTRRSALERFGGFDTKYKIFADYDLYIRMERSGSKVKNINTMVAYFSMEGVSQSLKSLLRHNREFKEIYSCNGLSYHWYNQLHYIVYTFWSIIYRRVRKHLIHQKSNSVQ